MEALRPQIVGNVHVDEVVGKVGGRNAWRWGAIDSHTRYVISGKHVCRGSPPRIVSDKLGHYGKAFHKYFLHTGTVMVHGVPIACRKRGLKYSNPAERDNGRVRQRTKTLRGFKAHLSAEAFLDLLDPAQLHRAQYGLGGRLPVGAAGIHLPLGRNRLLSFIYLASLAA